tara:strand:- start:212 stop:415 length:204 start_codon:yes stop_codon:yes gene_type:complete
MITVAIISNDDEIVAEYFVDMNLGDTKHGKPSYQPDKYKVPFIKGIFNTLPSLQPRRLGIHNPTEKD